MDNCVYVTREIGEKIKIEIILSFKIEEYKKQYIAYTLNDDGQSDMESVFISEITSDNKIISIPPEQASVVSDAYEAAKQSIEEM
jgi:uncharacterized protein YrzB (UPF0473 family)